nr:helix-turn-helix transcriptional regulator [Ruminococcus bromii]
MNFGKNCRKFRKQLGLTQSDLADKVGVRPPMINFIESEKKIPSLALSLEIANVLNTTVDELCKGA